MNNLQKNISKYYNAGLRYDGRKMGEVRPVTVEYGVSKNAEGSAKVTMGETVVFAGVKMGVEKPYDDTADQGNLMVNAELTPMASPDFESGPPSDWAIEISRVVDRTLREGKAVNLKKLCITEGEAVWSVMVDVVPVNDAGNLIDASALAALAAIEDAKYPVLEEGNKVDYKNHGKKVGADAKPVMVTVYKIAGQLVIDPDYEEEKGKEGRISIGVLENGTVCAMQKGDDAPFTAAEVSEALKLAKTTSEVYRKALK